MAIGGAVGIYKARKVGNDRNARADCPVAQLYRLSGRVCGLQQLYRA